MNVYTGDVFWHNLHFFASYHFDVYSDLGIPLKKPLSYMSSSQRLRSANRKVVAVFTYRLDRDVRWVVTGEDRDLQRARIECALVGYRRGLTDIIGRGWPAMVAAEDYRGGS